MQCPPAHSKSKVKEKSDTDIQKEKITLPDPETHTGPDHLSISPSLRGRKGGVMRGVY